MALSQTTVLKLYSTVIDDVIAGVRDAFLDEGVDEQVLQEMKQIWTNKLLASKAVEAAADPPEPQPPPSGGNVKANGTKQTKAARNAAAAAKELEAAANGNSSNLVANSGTMPMANGTTKKQQQQMIANSTAPSSIPPPLQPQQHNSVTQAQQQQQEALSQQSSSNIQQQQVQQQTIQQPPPQLPPPPPPAVAGLDPNKIVPIQITLPAQVGVAGSEQPRVLTIHVPASALQENQLHQMLTGPVITSIMPLPVHIASNILQQHVNAALQNQAMISNSITIQKQLDGANDTSDEDGSDVSDDNLDGDDDDDIDKDDDEEVDGEGGAEEEPLNSEDDVTDEDPLDLFDTDNVVVCQYDKITRSRNKWKFYLKDGIMNIGGKDYVFQKSNGDAEW